MQPGCQIPLPRIRLRSTSTHAPRMRRFTLVDSVISGLVPCFLRLPGSRLLHSQLNCYDVRFEKTWISVRDPGPAPLAVAHRRCGSPAAGVQSHHALHQRARGTRQFHGGHDAICRIRIHGFSVSVFRLSPAGDFPGRRGFHFGGRTRRPRGAGADGCGGVRLRSRMRGALVEPGTTHAVCHGRFPVRDPGSDCVGHPLPATRSATGPGLDLRRGRRSGAGFPASHVVEPEPRECSRPVRAPRNRSPLVVAPGIRCTAQRGR